MLPALAPLSKHDTFTFFFSDIPRVSLTLSQTLDGAIIRKGDTVYLHCEIKANPTVHTIEWSRDQVYLQILLFTFITALSCLKGDSEGLVSF